MITISFYSYKGGTGRTLAVANAALYLAQFGLKVAVLDFDLEAPGLHYKFRSAEPGNPITIQKGVVDYLYEFVFEQRLPDSLNEYVIEVPDSRSSDAVVQLIPAGSVPSADYWQKLARISWHELFYAPNAQGIHLFLELKEQIREELDPDFLLIDSRTGITEVGGLATTVLPEKLVCLVLPNRENLDGTRAVLRSLNHGPRLADTPPPEVTVVLSRIPAVDVAVGEEKLVANTLAFLNEEAERVEDTLNIPKLLVLHSEPDLLVREQLRIGGGKSPDESVLLRDYVGLFAQIIPDQVIHLHVGKAIDLARKTAREDPSAAQKALELLTYLKAPDVYRELLKVYRRRNISGKQPLQTVQRLWESTRDSSDPLLWNTVVKHFGETHPQERSYNGFIQGDLSLLRFVEAIWRQAGSTHVDVGCDLAASFRSFGDESHAGDLLIELVRNAGPNEKAVVRCLEHLRRASRTDEVRRIIEEFREPLSGSAAFLEHWAGFALGQTDKGMIQELAESDALHVLSDSDPSVAARVLLAANRAEDAGALAPRALAEVLRRGRSDLLAGVGSLYLKLGRTEEFEQIIKEKIGEYSARRILAQAKEF